MTDRDRYGLRGSVKTCEIHRTWYSRGCGSASCETQERNDIRIVEFAVRRMFTFGRCHRYDEHDRRIETSSNMAPNDFDRETFTYNDHGDVIWRVSESSHADYDFGEEGGLTPKPDSTRSHRSETQFRYQYDSHGNWVEKIVEAPAGTIWSIDRRTIRYFDAPSFARN
jgi:hypothetical protein